MVACESKTDLALCETTIRGVVDRHVYTPGAKSSESTLTRSIASALADAGFDVDEKDRKCLIPPGVSVWRYGSWIEPTARRREIDMVIYKDGSLVALLESEEDINDVRRDLVAARYFAQSIASKADGSHFHSYRSLERMAVAAAIVAHGPAGVVTRLEQLRSDSIDEHNPRRVPMFLNLACGRNDSGTPWRSEILRDRMESLGCKLIAREAAHV